jgi:glycosyltransferase involved in cell wall biosynthesis
MKIIFRQYLFANHSWAQIGRSLATAFIAADHQVDLFSTDGIEHLPNYLKPHLIGWCSLTQSSKITGRLPDNSYDLALSYTQMKNAPFYLSHSTKNRFLIWCWEWKGGSLPEGYAKHYKSCDLLLPPSNYAKEVFLEARIPEASMKIIPHGIDANQYAQTSTINLSTDKSFKILSNIAQTHHRKNIPALLEAYGKAFTNKDDVCLILKTKIKPTSNPTEIAIGECISKFNVKYPQHAELKVYQDFIEDISALYRSVDATFTMSHCEGFYLVLLEAAASGIISIAPNHGGQLDVATKANSLLIDGKETYADPKAVYFYQPGTIPKSRAIWFEPSIDDAVDKLRYAYANFEALNAKAASEAPKVREQYDWNNIAKRITNLCK